MNGTIGEQLRTISETLGITPPSLDKTTLLDSINLGLSAFSSASLFYNVKSAQFGATGNGTTDDSAAIQSAINAANSAGGGTVWIPAGSYALLGNGGGTFGTLIQANNVTIIGAGCGATILLPGSGLAAFYGTFSTGSPLTDFSISDLTIDGTNQGASYSVNYPGLRAQYCSACTFKNLVIQNCVASGLSTDYLTNGTTIFNVRAINNGRLNHGGTNGASGNGIGVGTGQTTVNEFTISQCYAYGNGRRGIMIESETGTTSSGMVISNCISEANYEHGFNDAGGNGAIWANCISYNNVEDGFTIDNGTVGGTAKPGGNGTVSSCVFLSNGRYGISYEPNTGTTASGDGNYSFNSCVMILNTSLGVNILSLPSHPVSGLYFTGCTAANNGASGYRVTTNPSNDVWFKSCIARSNGQISMGSHFGFEFSGNVTNGGMSDCDAFDDGGTQKQTYGLEIGAGVTLTNFYILGGNFTGNKTGSMLNSGTLTSSTIKSALGINPLTVNAPAFPLTTATYTNNTSVDIYAYLTNGSATMTTTINGNTGPSLAANATATIFIPSLGTFVPTYASGSPAWVFQGN